MWDALVFRLIYLLLLVGAVWGVHTAAPSLNAEWLRTVSEVLALVVFGGGLWWLATRKPTKPQKKKPRKRRADEFGPLT